MSKDSLVKRDIENIVSNLLIDAMSPVVTKYGLSGDVYVMVASEQGLESDYFQAPFSVTQLPPSFQAQQLLGIGYLKEGVTITQHIEKVASQHPGIPFIIDEKTALALSGVENRKIALIAYDGNHCLLTGLNGRGVDVFLAGDVQTLIEVGNLRIIKP